MTVSAYLDILQIDESQSQKATAVNIALEQLAKCLTHRLEINTDDLNTSGEDYVLPYNAESDLADRSGLHTFYYDLLAGASNNFDVKHPPVEHLFFARNRTAYNATFYVTGGGATLAPGKFGIFYCDGSVIIRIDVQPQTITQAHDMYVSFFDKPIADQVIGRFFLGRDVTIPANMSGARGRVGVNPTGAVSLTLRDDGVNIGTVSISTGGVVTFTTTSGTAKVVAAGSILDLVMQSTADATLENIELVILGTVNITQ